jgi:hypothetical protein
MEAQFNLGTVRTGSIAYYYIHHLNDVYIYYCHPLYAHFIDLHCTCVCVTTTTTITAMSCHQEATSRGRVMMRKPSSSSNWQPTRCALIDMMAGREMLGGKCCLVDVSEKMLVGR